MREMTNELIWGECLTMAITLFVSVFTKFGANTTDRLGAAILLTCEYCATRYKVRWGGSIR